MEVGTFEHDVLCSFVCAGSFTSEYSCYAHRLFLVAYCEVVLAEGVLYAVERNKFLSLVLILDNDVMTRNHIGIETMHWLSISHHNVVRYVNNVVYRAQSDDIELVLQPLRALLNLAVSDAQTSIATASIGVLNGHVDGHVMIVDVEL